MALAKVESEMHVRDPGFFLREAQNNAGMREEAIEKTVSLQASDHEHLLIREENERKSRCESLVEHVVELKHEKNQSLLGLEARVKKAYANGLYQMISEAHKKHK